MQLMQTPLRFAPVPTVSGNMVFDLFTVVAFIDAHHTVSKVARRCHVKFMQPPEAHSFVSAKLRCATGFSRATASMAMHGRMSSKSPPLPLAAKLRGFQVYVSFVCDETLSLATRYPDSGARALCLGLLRLGSHGGGTKTCKASCGDAAQEQKQGRLP